MDSAEAEAKYGKYGVKCVVRATEAKDWAAVATLLHIHPAGAREKCRPGAAVPENKERIFPLLAAVANETPTEVILALLQAYPDGAKEPEYSEEEL